MIGALLLRWGTRLSYNRINHKDLTWLMRGMAKDAVYEFPGHTPISNRYEGREAIETFLHSWFDQAAIVHYTVKRIAMTRPFALGLTNTLLVEWVGDEIYYDGASIHSEGVSVYQVRHGRTVAMRDYFFDTAPIAEASAHGIAAQLQARTTAGTGAAIPT